MLHAEGWVKSGFPGEIDDSLIAACAPTSKNKFTVSGGVGFQPDILALVVSMLGVSMLGAKNPNQTWHLSNLLADP